MLPLLPGEKPNPSLDCPATPDGVITLVPPKSRELPIRPMDKDELLAHVERLQARYDAYNSITRTPHGMMAARPKAGDNY